MERSTVSQTSGSRWKPNNSSTSNQNNQIKTIKNISIRRPSSSSQLIKPQIKEFLNKIQMDTYFDVFVQNGFDDFETLLGLKFQKKYSSSEVQEEHLAQMEIPKGHQLKFLSRIKEFKQSNGSKSGEESKQQDSKLQEEEEEPNNYIALEDPEIDQSLTQSLESQVSYWEKHKNESDPNFQEAVDGDRKQKIQNIKSSLHAKQKKSAKGKQVSFQRQEEPKKTLIEGLMEISTYLKEMDKKLLLTEGIEVQTDDVQNESVMSNESKPKLILQENTAEVLRVKKYSCWNCYKLWEKDYLLIEEKAFCSVKCFESFRNLYQVNCFHCQKEVRKNNCIIQAGVYLCSEECAKTYDFQVMKVSKEELKQYFNLGENAKDVDLDFSELCLN